MEEKEIQPCAFSFFSFTLSLNSVFWLKKTKQNIFVTWASNQCMHLKHFIPMCFKPGLWPSEIHDSYDRTRKWTKVAPLFSLTCINSQTSEVLLQDLTTISSRFRALLLEGGTSTNWTWFCPELWSDEL